LTSRLLITILIAFGIVLSGTGATLAMAPNVVDTGSTTRVGQYGFADNEEGGSLPEQVDSEKAPIGVLPEGPKSGVAPTTESGEAPRVQTAADRGSAPRLQPIRQQADQGESLPFTGLAAIPILVVGIGLLASGLVLRRRA
jgi:hypothetical protein